jgi:hypothetical protein
VQIFFSQIGKNHDRYTVQTFTVDSFYHCLSHSKYDLIEIDLHLHNFVEKYKKMCAYLEEKSTYAICFKTIVVETIYKDVSIHCKPV